jgi:hypothetical protein
MIDHPFSPQNKSQIIENQTELRTAYQKGGELSKCFPFVIVVDVFLGIPLG